MYFFTGINSDLLEIKFTGNDISPETIELEDLAKELTLLRDLLSPIIADKHPELAHELDFLAFSDIGNRSLSYRYRIKEIRDIVLASYSALILGITQRDAGLLPYDTVLALERTSDFNAKYGSSVSFGYADGSGTFQSLASFTDEFKKEKLHWVKGWTTKYGYFRSLGETKNGRLQGKLVLASGSVVAIHLDEVTARKYRSVVLENVRISGNGTWVGASLRLTSITPTEIVPFYRTDAASGFDLLARDLGKLWRNTDLDQFLSE